MKTIEQEEIEVRIANATKPVAYSNYSYPLNSLDDRIFEILTYSVFKSLISSNYKEIDSEFDLVELMQGVGEKGMDCILLKDSVVKGTIQCKKYSKNLSDTLLLKEVIKFSINALQESIPISRDDFKYYIATSTGYTGKAINLFTRIKEIDLLDKYDIEEITTKVISQYKEFENIKYSDIKTELIKFIQNLNFVLIKPSDFNLWINEFPEIVETFFAVKTVTDNELIEKKGNEIIESVRLLLNPKTHEDIASFIEVYKKAATAKLNVVNFIGFDLHRHRQKPVDITLTDLFVQPSFKYRKGEKNKKVLSVVEKELKIANVFKSDKSIIILGDPGAGKSLLVKFLIVQILEQQTHKSGVRQFSKHIPFRVELRKYNELRESKSIIEYISHVLSKEYQVSITPDLLKVIIEEYNTIIFFDGLDEIFNISHKNKMKEAIESFSSIYSKSKCIITSRFIGYHDIKFNPDRFDEFGIISFDEKQVKELVTKFYNTQIHNSEKRGAVINNCLLQLKNDVDDELKSNPLILTLILILASNNIVIPDSKLEIYEACTNTLVETIDTKEKELKFEIPIKNKRSIFAHLAYWQYELMSKNIEITYEKAIDNISDFLIAKGECTDYSDAEDKAKKFLEYAEHRSIYFENNFTHKTFLEYYTADYLFINYFAKARDSERKKLLTIITKNLSNSFWYIVFELLLSRIDKIQADDEVLDEIFAKQLESTSLNVFYFLVSNLSRINNTSNQTRKNIITKTISLCIKGEKITERGKRLPFDESSILFKIYQLQVYPELSTILQDVIYEFEDSIADEKTLIEFYNFYYELISLFHRRRIANSLKIKNEDRVKVLAYKDLLLFSHYYVTPSSSLADRALSVHVLKDQIENFGVKSLFKDMKLKYRENATRIDTYNQYLFRIVENEDYEKFKSDYYELVQYGLRHEYIMNHIKDSRLYFFFRSEGFEKVLKMYIKSDDSLLDEILINLIRKGSEMKIAFDSFKSKYNHPKLKQIDKLFDKR
ncbi:NACHT domain-containing protein [Pontibacter mangrovi]|uniref:NACHT domain-containing protein n=1 Tax=Pontibacter mangrovi TaxID=2589816 RepID=A0A501WGW4_9BACT|nr:NACHT domain-containing protein [Pontibacter mangrovi]TPE46257.1 NACHT domain-containing protein [Pontibacter mangrovi]